MEILVKGRRMLFDEQDAEFVLSRVWRLDKDGYASGKLRVLGRPGNQRTVFLHRVLCGEPAAPLVCDHINGDRLDNRRSNLRVVTLAQNAQNRHGTTARSGHRNVQWHARTKKWQVAVQRGGKLFYFGLFTDVEAAARRAAEARAEVFAR